MSITRPPNPGNEESRPIPPKVIQGINAARGLLLAAATFLAALTSLMVALMKN